MILCFFRSSDRLLRRYSPIISAFFIKPASIRSIVANDAAQDTGLPPNVLPWLPGGQVIALSFAIMAPIGIPEPNPFASVIISGTTPQFSIAKYFPVRPLPDWISSSTIMIPNSSQKERTCSKNSSGGTMYPPSPCMGSTKTAAMVCGWTPFSFKWSRIVSVDAP